MDFDLFLTYPRWDILKIITERASSPIEIAKKINTTVAYVSQQLKLLDAAGLVNKQKTGASEKGKPRTLFSLSKNLVYLSVLSDSFSDKKLIYLNNHHISILKIWYFVKSSLQASFERMYDYLESQLESLDGIFIDKGGVIGKLIVVSENNKLKNDFESYCKKINNEIPYQFVSEKKFNDLSKDKLIELYSSEKILSLRNLKGGNR